MANAADINQKFNELNISTAFNAYSGFTAEDLENGNVKIFDDYDSAECDPDALLAELETQDAVDWNEVIDEVGELDRFWGIFSALNV